MYSIKSDLDEKIEDAEVLIAHLRFISQTKNSVKVSAILKSSFMLVLYNMIESITTVVFDRIHEEIADCNYSKAIPKLRAKYVDYYFAKSTSNDYKKNFDSIVNGDLKLPLLSVYQSKVQLFSGNIDGRKLNSILSSYGIEPIKNKNRADLKVIKEKRNKIAHGEESFTDSCRIYTIQDLEKYLSSVSKVLKELITVSEVYINSEAYRYN